jgi:cytochrome P450
LSEDDRKEKKYHFDRHTPQYRHQFEAITAEMQSRCPVAWSDTYGGHFVVAGHQQVFEIARAAEYVSNEFNPAKGRYGIIIPGPMDRTTTSSILEMDPPRQRYYRQALNPYLSPAAANRWIPVVDELVRACLDEKIESGRIDFVDDLANIVPAVLTLGMLGFPMTNWEIYVEPTHASVYVRMDSPEWLEIRRKQEEMGKDIFKMVQEIRASGRPGLVHALVTATIDGGPAPDKEIMEAIGLLIGGGFDTTTALTAHSLEWLGENPGERTRLAAEQGELLDTATEEFLRYFTPAPGDGRTVTGSCTLAGQRFEEGDRVYVSWAMANRDPSVFENPNDLDLARTGNRHMSFGLGLHRCIGSNVARVAFKRMLSGVLDRMPDYVCDPSGTVHYDTIGVINGMKNLPAAFTPGSRRGPGLAETIEALQKVVDEQRLAAPVTRSAGDR